MEHTRQFIEDCIKAEHPLYTQVFEQGFWEKMETGAVSFVIHAILLDAKAWQAVGKTRGWGDTMVNVMGVRTRNSYRIQWHTFIDALADGASIEEALTNKIESL